MLYFLQTFTFVCLKFPNVQTISSDRREMNHFSDTLNFSYLSQLARVNEPRCLNTHKFWMMNPTNSEYWVLRPRPHNFNYDCVHVCVSLMFICVCVSFMFRHEWDYLSTGFLTFILICSVATGWENSAASSNTQTWKRVKMQNAVS